MDQQLLSDIQRTKNQSSSQEGMTSTIGPEDEELSDESNNNESFFFFQTRENKINLISLY